MSARELLERAVAAQGERPLYTAEAVLEDISRGMALPWMGRESLMVTKIEDYHSTQERVVECWLAAGDLDEIVHAIRPAIEDYARKYWCSQGAIIGRRGWGRVLAPYGYTEHATVFRKLFT